MKYPIQIEKTETSRLSDVDFDNVEFGKYYTDHMLVADYKDGDWQSIKIIPYGDIQLSPATSSIHYGQSIFEGMKAYKDPKGTPQLFRPEKNLDRFNLSAVRMGMPEVPREIFIDGLYELMHLDKGWIPTTPYTSLYVRPFMFATDAFIGIKPTQEFKFMIICSPAGAYYNKPVKVKVADKYARAFPGGTGFAKAAGNYGATMMPLKEVKEEGFDQVLWLDAKEFKYVEEIGTMNVIFQIGDSFITPAIKDTFLNGITRDSVIHLLKHKGYTVEERDVEIKEIHEAFLQGNLKAAFGTGTAATIASIGVINYKGQDLTIPAPQEGDIVSTIKNTLEAIKTSKEEDPFGWVVKIETGSLV